MRFILFLIVILCITIFINKFIKEPLVSSEYSNLSDKFNNLFTIGNSSLSDF